MAKFRPIPKFTPEQFNRRRRGPEAEMLTTQAAASEALANAVRDMSQREANKIARIIQAVEPGVLNALSETKTNPAAAHLITYYSDQLRDLYYESVQASTDEDVSTRGAATGHLRQLDILIDAIKNDKILAQAGESAQKPLLDMAAQIKQAVNKRRSVRTLLKEKGAKLGSSLFKGDIVQGMMQSAIAASPLVRLMASATRGVLNLRSSKKNTFGQDAAADKRRADIARQQESVGGRPTATPAPKTSFSDDTSESNTSGSGNKSINKILTHHTELLTKIYGASASIARLFENQVAARLAEGEENRLETGSEKITASKVVDESKEKSSLLGTLLGAITGGIAGLVTATGLLKAATGLALVLASPLIANLIERLHEYLQKAGVPENITPGTTGVAAQMAVRGFPTAVKTGRATLHATGVGFNAIRAIREASAANFASKLDNGVLGMNRYLLSEQVAAAERATNFAKWSRGESPTIRNPKPSATSSIVDSSGRPIAAASDEAAEAAKAAAKAATKVGTEVVETAATRGAVKFAAGTAKVLGKAVPFTGLGLGAASAYLEGKEAVEELKKGNYERAGSRAGIAGLELLSGIVGMAPGLGTAFSLALSGAALTASLKMDGNFDDDTATATRVDPANETDVNKIMATIKQRESKGDYKKLTDAAKINPKNTASGAYQITDGTWQDWTQRYKIGTQWSKAMDAPPDIQDAVAKEAVIQILKENGGNVEAVPTIWYTGNRSGEMTDSALANNNGLTSAQYNQIWMSDYSRMNGTPSQRTGVSLSQNLPSAETFPKTGVLSGVNMGGIGGDTTQNGRVATLRDIMTRSSNNGGGQTFFAINTNNKGGDTFASGGGGGGDSMSMNIPSPSDREPSLRHSGLA